MRADFALVDQTLFTLMHEFDRVFHGQDVAHLSFVAMIDHRGQRGGFARAGWSRDQYQTARIFGNRLETLGGLQVFQGQYLGRNGTHDRTRSAVVHKSIDTKTRESGNLEGEVDLLVLFVSLALPVVHAVSYTH